MTAPLTCQVHHISTKMTEGIVIERKTGGEEPLAVKKDFNTAYAPSDQGKAASTPSSQPDSAPQTAPGELPMPDTLVSPFS